MRQWIESIRECRNSGKTVKTWCAEQGVNETSFYYWQKQIREAASQKLLTCRQPSEEIAARPQPVFTELELQKEEPAKGTAVIIHLEEGLVEIQNGASVSTIENTLRVLKTYDRRYFPYVAHFHRLRLHGHAQINRWLGRLCQTKISDGSVCKQFVSVLWASLRPAENTLLGRRWIRIVI